MQGVNLAAKQHTTEEPSAACAGKSSLCVRHYTLLRAHCLKGRIGRIGLLAQVSQSLIRA